MNFKAVAAALFGVVLAAWLMVQFNMATHSSPFTVATSQEDKAKAAKMSTPGKATGGYVI